MPLVLVLSCGASYRHKYEEDIRFEHCMALDARPDMKPTLRRACWQEWSSFFTFGQTRDRIDFARIRVQQLSAASDFDEADWVRPTSHGAAVPDPISALAPPPMLFAFDGGVVDASEPTHAPSPRAAACLSECDRGLEVCRHLCAGPPCETACAARLQRCSKRCEP